MRLALPRLAYGQTLLLLRLEYIKQHFQHDRNMDSYTLMMKLDTNH